MPYYDGTGPMGTGSVGRRMGPCCGGARRNFGAGNYGLRRRIWTQTDELSALDNEEKALEEELKAVREEKKQLTGKKN